MSDNKKIRKWETLKPLTVALISGSVLLLGILVAIILSPPSKKGDAVKRDTEVPSPAVTSVPEEQDPLPTEEPTVAPTEAPAPTETPAPAPDTSSAGKTLFAIDVVNVREQPNTECEVLGKLQVGQTVTCIEKTGDWYKVNYQGQTAYVKADYLAEGDGTDLDPSKLSNEKIEYGYDASARNDKNVPLGCINYDSNWKNFDADFVADTSKNVIYLTMDEGFGNDNTIKVLDTLKEKNVKVVFFLTRYFIDDRPELVQRMLDEGHQLGNHSKTHPDMTSLSIDEQKEQVAAVQDIIKEKYGYDIKYFRYPQGAFSASTLAVTKSLGLRTVFWSYAYGDYDTENQPPVDESLKKAVDSLHPGAIYLLHANSDTNVAMLGDFIDSARAKGFEFGVYSPEA